MIPLFYDKYLLDTFNIKIPVNWDYTAHPHALYVGATGTGKSYACALALGRISLHIPHAQAFVCNFKGGDDFKFLDSYPRYYTFLDCSRGLQDFYNILLARQSGADTSLTFNLLFFDEWAAFVSSLDKKAADNAKSQLSALLMMGRSFNLHVLISQQRADVFQYCA